MASGVKFPSKTTAQFTTSTSFRTVSQDGLLVIQNHDARVSFQVIAVGCERALQALAADSPELVMPRIGGLGARLREVAIRNDVTWSMSELAGIVNAVTGVHPTEEHVLRGELLHQY